LLEGRGQGTTINSLSFGIVCYETPLTQLEKLLGSILQAIAFIRTRQTLSSIVIYVIDNSERVSLSLSSICRQQELIEALAVDVRHIHGHGNLGYGRAQNLLLGKLESDFHVILNPDITLEEDALFEGFKVFTNNPSVVMASPNARDIRGEKLYLCKRYPSLLVLLMRGILPQISKVFFQKKLASYEMRELPESTVASNIPLISGCFMIADTRAFQKVGGFDERYFLYFEDFDLSLRMRSIGQLAYAPRVRITHAGGQAAKKGLRHIWFFVQSGVRFFQLHGWRLI
tara:strand:- start:9513 stop:10370 length:858 start_codon:yes stop_codon:yes gene_type:complete